MKHNKLPFKESFIIDCQDKTIIQKKTLWNVFKKWGYEDVCIEDGMFNEGRNWYDAKLFLISLPDKAVHPRKETEGRQIISYNEFVGKYCNISWRERYNTTQTPD